MERGYYRTAPVAIYAGDPVQRQARSLQATAVAGEMDGVRIAPSMAQHLGVKAGDRLKCEQGTFSCVLRVIIDPKQPSSTVSIPLGLKTTMSLPYQAGPLNVTVYALQNPAVKESMV